MKKNILLIGGSHGIGFSIANQLQKEHNVFVASRTKDEIADLNITHIPFDVLTQELDTTTLPEELQFKTF